MSASKATSTAAVAATRPSLLKLFIPTGQATPSPPIGPTLGQKGVKAIDFCRQFNDASSRLFLPALPLRCRITVQPDKTFAISVRPPATSWLLKRAAGIEKASSRFKVAEMSAKVVYEIARQKHRDPALQHLPLESLYKSILASARSYGFHIF